jgi:hypothetical protein
VKAGEVFADMELYSQHRKPTAGVKGGLGITRGSRSPASVKAALRAPRSRPESLATGLCASAYHPSRVFPFSEKLIAVNGAGYPDADRLRALSGGRGSRVLNAVPQGAAPAPARWPSSGKEKMIQLVIQIKSRCSQTSFRDVMTRVHI